MTTIYSFVRKADAETTYFTFRRECIQKSLTEQVGPILSVGTHTSFVNPRTKETVFTLWPPRNDAGFFPPEEACENIEEAIDIMLNTTSEEWGLR